MKASICSRQESLQAVVDACGSYINCVQDANFIDSSSENFENLANQLVTHQANVANAQCQLHTLSDKLHSLSPWIADEKLSREESRLAQLNQRYFCHVPFRSVFSQ